MPELRKIISVNPGGNFGHSAASVHILWPCSMFTVTMPAAHESSLNVMESCVLRLARTESGRAKNIAEVMCIGEDLTGFILDRLMSRGFIDENHELTDAGMSEIGENSQAPQSAKVFTVLKDCVTGSLVRHIHSGAYTFLDVTEDKGSTVKFLPDSQNRDKYILARSIFADTLKMTPPKPSEIIRLLKRVKKFSGTLKPSAVVVNNVSETVYLHCMVLLPDSEGEIIVTNGFGRPSERFLHALIDRSQTSAQWLNRIREGASQRTWTDFSSHSQKAASYMKILIRRIESTSGLSANTEASSSSIREIYSGIERALSEALKNTSARGGKWAGVFGGRQADSFTNGKKFMHYARQAGFCVSDDMAGFMEIPPGRFRAYDSGGEGDMWTLLALSSAQANDDPYSPLRVIAREDSCFLKFIAGLTQMRNSVSHGGAFSSDDPDFWRGVISRTEFALKYLLPDINTESNAEGHNFTDASSRARAELEKIFGFAYVSAIKDKGLFRQLVRVEMMLEGQPDSDQLLEIVTSLASCIQLLAEEHIRENLMYRTEINNISQALAAKIKAAGFIGNFDSLTSTNASRIMRSARGENGTLGSSVSAFILLEESESLKNFAGLCPDFAALVSRLIVLRGHGSVWGGLADVNEIRELKEKVYSIIKIFGEAF